MSIQKNELEIDNWTLLTYLPILITKVRKCDYISVHIVIIILS